MPTWLGRDSLGRLVDIHSESEGEGVQQMSPLEVSGVQTVRMLGPYHVTFQTPGIGSSEDGALLTELDAGISVIQVMAIVGTAWEDGTSLGVMLGGDDYAAPNDDFTLLANQWLTANLNPGGGSGYAIGLSSAAFGVVGAAGGALIAQCAGSFTAGEADIYALIAEPA